MKQGYEYILLYIVYVTYAMDYFPVPISSLWALPPFLLGMVLTRS